MKKWNQQKNMFVLHQWSPAGNCHMLSVGGTLDEAINGKPIIGPFQRLHMVKLADTYDEKSLHQLVQRRESCGRYTNLPRM